MKTIMTLAILALFVACKDSKKSTSEETTCHFNGRPVSCDLIRGLSEQQSKPTPPKQTVTVKVFVSAIVKPNVVQALSRVEKFINVGGSECGIRVDQGQIYYLKRIDSDHMQISNASKESGTYERVAVDPDIWEREEEEPRRRVTTSIIFKKASLSITRVCDYF